MKFRIPDLQFRIEKAAMSIKQKVYEHCQRVIDTKLKAYQDVLNELSTSMAAETKSSAGNKYETGRAMLHIEQDNVRKQLADAQAQKAVLDGIDPKINHVQVAIGSLVETTTGHYFLSTALGKIIVDGQLVIALSKASPLGNKLMGLQVGDSIEITGTATEIISIR